MCRNYKNVLNMENELYIMMKKDGSGMRKDSILIG